MTTPTPAQQLEEVLALVANYDLLTPQPFMFDDGLGGDSEWCICDSKSNFTGAEMDKQDALAFSAAVNWLRQHGSRALAALEAVECDCATKVNQVCDKCCAKTEAVWLMPVATMEPQNGKLLQYAHGRSHLSTGQMAHAYECIAEAAKECGQIIPADAVEVSRG